MNQSNPTLLNTEGLSCPEPIMLLHKSIRQLKSGDHLKMSATDPASCRDVANFCRHLGHTLLEQIDEQGNGGVIYYFLIQKK